MCLICIIKRASKYLRVIKLQMIKKIYIMWNFYVCALNKIIIIIIIRIIRE
jgi:hypothetical protein